jgi:REP element-mobilizing transposase RayT
MGRRERLDVAGAWHHVMNRGAGGQAVFRTQHDGRLFESLLGEASGRSTVEVHAYCLMPNHFHVLLHCPDGGLSSFMQSLVGRFTRAINQRSGSDGAIFRGRFHSVTTDDLVSTHRMADYIHRNPLDLPGADRAETYRWSSLRGYLDPALCPPWLHTDVLTGVETSIAPRAWTTDQLVDVLDLLIAAHLDVTANQVRSIRRALCVDLASSGPVRDAAAAALSFSTPAAARQAMRRAQQLLASSPDMRRIAGIVRRLAG